MTRMAWSPSALSVASMASSDGGAPRPFRQDSSASLVVTSVAVDGQPWMGQMVRIRCSPR